MSETLKHITISIPARLFEAGLTEAQVHGLVNRWLVISLFKQRKISPSAAAEILSTDLDGFFKMLDEQGILYENFRENHGDLPRVSPTLSDLAQAKSMQAMLEEQLAEARYQLHKVQQELKGADKVRSEFIATVSHELRTPLNSIIGFAKLLLNQRIGPLNEVQHTDLSLIYNSALHLQSLVNDILDLSKIDAGKIRLDMEWLAIEEIIAGVIPTTMILIEAKPIDLREEIEPKLPKIFVDRGRIRQVVLNLLSNAAKFTDAGSINLQIYKISKEDEPFICFAVKDTGIGIAENDADKVFEAFRQIDSSLGRRAEGTGLGMPISRRLAHLHGGDLWFESKAGQGSTFYLSVPVNPPDFVRANNSKGKELSS